MKNQSSKMCYLWSYIVMALCIAMTSCRVMDFPGNKNDFHDDLVPSVKNEKGLAPPSSNESNIDSYGFHGNSNELKSKTLNEKPPYEDALVNNIINEILKANNFFKNFEIVPFDKEDFIKFKNFTLQNS